LAVLWEQDTGDGGPLDLLAGRVGRGLHPLVHTGSGNLLGKRLLTPFLPALGSTSVSAPVGTVAGATSSSARS